MDGRQDERQEAGQGREQQDRSGAMSQDPVHPGTRAERSVSPEELAQRRREEMRRERGEDEMREDEF
ncbi:hypothetical protein ABZZ17_34635 [Streptomyces sp. NPDC006512]|uniref:hypothetical protein n=1 Tax=Streptomyces sp. NPDC006512 TaxID=3154307 RepID=UPI0033AEE703